MKREDDILASLKRIEEALGIVPRPQGETALAKAQEAAKKFKEKREEDLKRSLEARVRAGMADPEVWSEDDDFASQMA